MEISMFGPLQVREGDRVLGPRDLGGVKPRQVLELLLLARAHGVHRRDRDGALAGGGEPRNVVATLNTYVCVLRHSMFDDQAHARRVIVTGPGAYRLALEEVDLDLDRFDDLLLQAERAPRQERIRLLTAAVGLAGGPVLEHARYDEWVQEDVLLVADRTTHGHLDLASNWLVEGQRSPACGTRSWPWTRTATPRRHTAGRRRRSGRHDAVRRTLDAAGPCSTATSASASGRN